MDITEELEALSELPNPKEMARKCLREINDLRLKVADLERSNEALESLRPVWAQGWTDDGVAAQASSAALSSIWSLLGVDNQTAAMEALTNTWGIARVEHTSEEELGEYNYDIPTIASREQGDDVFRLTATAVSPQGVVKMVKLWMEHTGHEGDEDSAKMAALGTEHGRRFISNAPSLAECNAAWPPSVLEDRDAYDNAWVAVVEPYRDRLGRSKA